MTPRQRDRAWRIAVDLAALPAPGGVLDPGRRLALVLSAVSRCADESFIADHAHPAIERLAARLQETTRVRRFIDRGTQPRDPEVSIVIPLYRRLDLLGLQVALLADDPDVRQAELILVLDSPEQEGELAELSHDLHRLYGLPFRILVLSGNGGYAIANNVGVEHATGSLVLLLNSDVFPIEHGWLQRMARAYREGDRIGALAPKLLYEDGALQHAGLFFERHPVRTGWENQHFFKGLPSGHPAANVTRRVPAVTGACMLVDRSVFRGVGGFSPSYVRGEYEDSDLCLRLAAEGYESWYFSEVELYHLERQSLASDTKRERRGATRHNRWLQSQRWRIEIEQLMTEFESSSGASSSS